MHSKMLNLSQVIISKKVTIKYRESVKSYALKNRLIYLMDIIKNT
jgi:hypothetical protein